MRAYITRAIPESAVQFIGRACDVEVWRGTDPPSEDILRSKASSVDGLLCLLTDKINSQLLDSAPNLRVISQMAVGVDNIDVTACTARGIPVGNTPGVLTETTADLAFALILAAARRVVEADRFTRSGEWTTWSPMQLTGPDVHHATLGIVGMGRIGQQVAKRARGFDMRVLYHNRHPDAESESEYGAEFRELDDLLEQSDFVSIHTPLTPETRGLMGRHHFARMKSTAIFVNTSRGPVVDEAALYEALRDGIIAGAGLDVYEVEPLPLSSPLLTLPNVVTLPHMGSASVETRARMAMLAAENLTAGLQGCRLPHVVNPEVYEN